MRRIVMATAVAIALLLGPVRAAGPFDGQYAGGSPAANRACPATTATITITDGKITGAYKVLSYSFPITGTVAPDGMVTGKWSTNVLTGKIAGGRFTGSVDSTECKAVRPITLDKTG